MTHYMKLELKKVQFKHYIFISALAILMGKFFFVSLNDSSSCDHRLYRIKPPYPLRFL